MTTGELGGRIIRCVDDVDPDLALMSTHSIACLAGPYLGSVADRIVARGGRPPSVGGVDLYTDYVWVFAQTPFNHVRARGAAHPPNRHA